MTPAPLSADAFDLHDLAGGADPIDSKAEAEEVRRAVVAVGELLADGHSVAVHCRVGVGRTGLVIGSILVASGHDPGNRDPLAG